MVESGDQRWFGRNPRSVRGNHDHLIAFGGAFGTSSCPYADVYRRDDHGTAVVHLHRLVPDAHAIAATAFTEQAEGGYSMRNVVKIDYPDDAEHRFSYPVAPSTTETVSMTFTARVGPDATCSARTTS